MDARQPISPNLGFYRKLAKELKRALAERDSAAAARFAKSHSKFRDRSAADVFAAKVSLADAQLVIAREHGCSSWAEFKEAVSKAVLTPKPSPSDELMSAVRAADLDTVRALCARHARLAAQRDSKGSWPLVEACDRGALEIARALLDAGADAKQGDPLLAAAHAGPHKKGPALAVVALLLDRGAPNDLFTHALLGRVDELKRDLLGADVNALGPADSSALFLAAWNGQREAVQVLLDAGAEPNPVGRNGQSTWQCLMLHIWSERHREIARLLLARGVPCTFQEACILSHTPTIERMLAVDPGLKDRANDAGVTPLGIAVLNADVELARILLAAGAADPKGRAHALVHGVRCSDEDLSERVYRNCALKRTNFHDCNLEDSTFSNVNLAGVRIDNVNLSGASIDNAFITGLTIYGIDVEPLLRRELTRRAARKRETS